MTTQPAQAVVIGASAGALDALTSLLPALPAGYPLPVFIVVHLPSGKKSVMAELLRAKCKLAVEEAEDKEEIKPGTIYIAPPDYHLLVEAGKTISLSSDEPVLFSRPSIDVLFESAADVYGGGLVGIVLTGANNDGAAGLKMIAEAGGSALVQRPDLAYAAAMPQAAIDTCPSAQVLTLDQIADCLQKAAPT